MGRGMKGMGKGRWAVEERGKEGGMGEGREEVGRLKGEGREEKGREREGE